MAIAPGVRLTRLYSEALYNRNLLYLSNTEWSIFAGIKIRLRRGYATDTSSRCLEGWQVIEGITMTEKLTLKKLSGELDTLRARVKELELQLERKLEITLEKAAAKLQSRIESTRSTEHGSSIDAEVRQQMIEEEAYLIAERRGFQGGDAAEDWARAEQQVNHRLIQESIVGKPAANTKRSVTNKTSSKASSRAK